MGTIKKTYILVAVVFLFSAMISAFAARQAFGAATQSLVRFDRMKINTPTTGTVCFTPEGTGTEASVKVTFPNGYTLGTAANFTVNTTDLAWPSGATAWPGIATASNVTSQVVTFTSTDLTVDTMYCFNWTDAAAVKQPSATASSEGGTIVTYDSGSAQIDSASFSTATISNDQIVVNATVPQIFEFSLSGNVDNLPTLNSGTVTSSSSPVTATVNTNALNGWQVWARDAYQGLCSASVGTCTDGTATDQIVTTNTAHHRTLTAGTTDYALGVKGVQDGSSAGTLAVDTAFTAPTAGQGGGLSATALQSLATSDGTAKDAVLTLTNNVAISATVPAASDYKDVITVVGAGLF